MSNWFRKGYAGKNEKLIMKRLICGTSYHGTFNIPQQPAVTAGAGIKIAKHGNKAISSSSGSADVLESLGININKSVAHQNQISKIII